MSYKAKPLDKPARHGEVHGFTFKGKKIRWTDEALGEFKKRVRKYTGRSWGVSMSYRMGKLSEYIRGWMGYYGISEYCRPMPVLDNLGGSLSARDYLLKSHFKFPIFLNFFLLRIIVFLSSMNHSSSSPFFSSIASTITTGTVTQNVLFVGRSIF